MKSLSTLTIAMWALIGNVPSALAVTQIGDYFSVSGFGTIGSVQTNSNEGKFGRDRQAGGADKTGSLDVDSNFGVQTTATATAWLSATLQLLAAKRDKSGIEPEVEWAFVNVKPLDGLSFRAGRMANPVFLISDSRNVGYANTWVRAPNEVYALNIFRKLDGGDINYRADLGPLSLSVTGFAGKSKFRVLGDIYGAGENIRGLNLRLESEWVTIRAGRMTADVTVPVTNLRADRYTFSGVGVTFDRDNIVGQAEYVQRRSEGGADSVNANSSYVLGGYRFGTILPYVILAKTTPKMPSSLILLSGQQKTMAVGVRWDASNSIAVKFQVDRINTDNTSGISFTTSNAASIFPGVPPGNAPLSRPVTAVSLAVDFIF